MVDWLAAPRRSNERPNKQAARRRVTVRHYVRQRREELGLDGARDVRAASLSLGRRAAKSCLPRVGEGEVLRKWAGIWVISAGMARIADLLGVAQMEHGSTNVQEGKTGVE